MSILSTYYREDPTNVIMYSFGYKRTDFSEK